MTNRTLIVLLLAGCAQPGEAPHPSPPQIVALGGDVLATPTVVPIFFTGDAAVKSSVETFLGALAGDTYWSATTSEYGVGPLAIAPAIVSADAPPATDTALATWVAGSFGKPGWPAAPDPQAIYTVFLPAGAALHAQWGDSCVTFSGYHDETTTPSGSSIVLAVLPRCGGGDVHGVLDALTAVTSHELVEAVTDPHWSTAPAFGDVDPDHYIWAYTPGGEVGDMCAYVDAAYARIVDGFLVQRTWSNAAAVAGHDPCVPAAWLYDHSYLGVAPELPDRAPLASYFTGTITTDAVDIPVGTSKAIDIDLFSDDPSATWSVDADDLASRRGLLPELTFQWDRTTGGNGDKLKLTITRVRASFDQPGSEFVVYSKPPTRDLDAVAGSAAMWWGYVPN